MTILKNIVVNPRIHFGKPCIAGTRIPVQNVKVSIHLRFVF